MDQELFIRLREGSSCWVIVVSASTMYSRISTVRRARFGVAKSGVDISPMNVKRRFRDRRDIVGVFCTESSEMYKRSVNTDKCKEIQLWQSSIELAKFTKKGTCPVLVWYKMNVFWNECIRVEVHNQKNVDKNLSKIP